MQKLKDFKKKGYIHIENFYSNEIIENLSKRCAEIIYEENPILYKINPKDINYLKIENNLKNKILDKMQFKEINFYKIEDFLYFFDQLISNYSERERLFILENIHANTCQIFQKKDIDVIFDIKLRELIINSELLKISKEILQTNKLIYWGESGFQFNKPAVRGWHTDDPINTLRNKFNDTFQIRIAIYFHSSKKNSGGIKVRPKSHIYISFKQYFRGLLKKRLNFNDFKRIRLLKSKNIFPNKTDLIIWDKRLFHSPWATKLRLNYNFNLSPKIEKHLHKSLIEPPCFPRSLLGFDFGKDCKELNNYLHNWISLRDDYYEYWKFKSEKYFNKININKSEIYLNDCCINPCNKNFSRNAKKNQSELLK